MSLVEIIDRFYRFYQSKNMTPNIEYQEKFNSMESVIEHYSGTIWIHKKICNNMLAELTDGVYIENLYTANQIAEVRAKCKEKILARMFLTQSDKA